MNKYLKYSLLFICVIAIAGLVFYLVNKPEDYVLNNIPYDVTYCLAIDKKALLKEKSNIEMFEKNKFIKDFKAKIPKVTFEIFKTIGIHPLGDLALFGQQNDEYNLVWIGHDEDAFKRLIEKKKWVVKKTKNNHEIKISDQLFLKYRWPIIEISSNKNEHEFFNSQSKKLSQKDIENSLTQGCLVYGFVVVDRALLFNYPFLPLYGKAFVGLKKDNKKIELVYVQRRLKLAGKLGLPKKLPLSHAVLSWPIDSGQIPKINAVPSIVMNHLNQLVNKPVKHLYAEVLDTITTYTESIIYPMNDEFQITQKFIKTYTHFPGLRLQFMKSKKEQDFEIKPSRTVNLGLDKLKLNYQSLEDAFLIYSENELPLASNQSLPDYYIYANLEHLRTDPYWDIVANIPFKTLQFHAENYDKGSVFYLTLISK